MSYFNGPQIVTNKLELYLDAANTKSYPGNGNTWYDLSGKNRHATLNGPPALLTNPNCFDITSDSTYISLSNTGLVPRTNNFTYCMWIKFDAFDVYDTLFENGSWTDTLLFRHQNGNTIYVYAEGGLRGTFSFVPSTSLWYNLVFLRQNNICSLYVNGISIGTTFSMNLDINLANNSLWLMRSQHSINQFTNGKLCIFSIYSEALSVNQIQQNYNALKGRFGL